MATMMTINECPMSGGAIALIVFLVLAVVGCVVGALKVKGKGPFAKDGDSG